MVDTLADNDTVATKADVADLKVGHRRPDCRTAQSHLNVMGLTRPETPRVAAGLAVTVRLPRCAGSLHQEQEDEYDRQ